MVVIQRRSTSQRAVITSVLAGTDEFVSAQDLHAALRGSGSTVGLATVYRALQEMAAAGDLDMVRNETGEVLYRQCEQPAHHHHLVCRSCGLTPGGRCSRRREVGPCGGTGIRLRRPRPPGRVVRPLRNLRRQALTRPSRA